MRAAVVALILLALAAPARTDEPTGAPASLRTHVGAVPDFTLTERSGKQVRRDDLKGKVWVAAFTYTCCDTGCDKLTANLVKLQKRLADCPDARIVTFSVHPEQDTPAVLEKYAKKHEADADRWLFLTGDEKAMYALVEQGFKLAVSRNKDAPKGQDVQHSFFFMVVDRRGQIRGYLDGRKAENMQHLEKRVRELVAARAGDPDASAADDLDAPQPRPEPPQTSVLPAVNALLNGACALLLILGYVSVRHGRITLHKVCMLTALCVSVVFLGCYLYYHFAVKNGEPTRFPGVGWVQPVYYGILGTHTVLAALVAPLALLTTYRGLRGTITKHTRLARWTLPIWLYVSVTGVVVYWMLYQLYPAH